MVKSENTADKVIAARMAREAAERARRAEIMSKIHELEKEKAECMDCVSGLNAVSGQLAGLASSWSTLFSYRMKSNIVREVTIPGAFEGIAATTIKNGMSNALGKMKASMTGIDRVMGAVSVQIGKLNQYIDKLDSKIESLRASL